MDRPKRAAVRKGANDAKEDDVAAKNPASRPGKNKAVESKAGPSGGSGDHGVVPPKATTKATKSKITVSKGRVKLPQQKVDQDEDNSDSTGSSPEAGNSKAMPPTPYPARIDFSSSPDNSDDGMQEEVEKPPKKVASKATTTTTKAKVGSKKAEEPMEDDKASDKEEANGNVSGPKDEDVEKLENTTKKTKPVAKKVTAKPKVGSKRAAPPSPKPDESSDMVAADPEAGSSPEKGKKVTATAVRKGPVKGKPAAKKTGQKAAEEVAEESGSSEEDKDVKLQTKGRGKKPGPASKTGPKGKKTVPEEVKGQGAEKKPSGKGPKAAAKGASKEALSADKKPAGGKVKAPPAKNQDAFDDSLSNDSAEVIDASSDEEGNNAAPMDSSTEAIAVELGLLKKPVAAKSSPPKVTTTETKPSSSRTKSGDDEEVISDSNRSGSDSGSDNKENDLDVVMDNLQIISEESAPENAAAESEPTPEPPKKRAAATRKKQPELAATSKPKAGPSAANRGTKNRTLPATFESAKATTSAEDMKKSLLARKSYATRSKVKAKAGTSATSTAATTKTKK